MRPKKLIYVLNRYSDSDASHFAHVLHLLEVLAEEGCDIVLVIEKPEGLPRLNHQMVSVVGLQARFPLLRLIELSVRLTRLIFRGYRTTFVRISAPSSIVASVAHRIFAGQSYLWQSGTTHEYDASQPPSLAKVRWWMTSYLPNWLARKLVHRFVTGPESMVDYYANIVGVRRDKIRVLYNDIELARFAADVCGTNRAQFLLDHKLPPETVILLLVHRLSPVRRTLTYLEPLLAALLSTPVARPWALVVVGGGPELNRAKALAARLGAEGQCIFLGEVPNRSIADAYAVADIFIHPSYAEGFPRVLLEAMAAGLPIVTTDAGGTRQLLGPAQQSYVLDRLSPAKFAERVLDLISVPEQWAVLAVENKKEVARFSTRQVASMYIRTLFE